MAGKTDNRNPVKNPMLAGHTQPPPTPPTDPRQVDLDLQRERAKAAESAAANPAAPKASATKQEYEIHSGFAKSRLESAVRIYNAALSYVIMHNADDIDELREGEVLVKKIKGINGLRAGQQVWQIDTAKADAWIAANPKAKAAGSSGRRSTKMGYEMGSHDLGGSREYVIATKITRSLVGGNLNIVAEDVKAIIATSFVRCDIHKVVGDEVMIGEVKLRTSTAGAEFPKERFGADGIIIPLKKSEKDSTRTRASTVYVAEFKIVGANGEIQPVKLIEWGKRNLLDSVMRRYNEIFVMHQYERTAKPAPEAVVIDQPAQ